MAVDHMCFSVACRREWPATRRLFFCHLSKRGGRPDIAPGDSSTSAERGRIHIRGGGTSISIIHFDSIEHWAMVRCLLHDAFMQDSPLIPHAAQWRWRVEWNSTEQIESFQTLIQTTSKSHRVCIFIDGLDEYEGDFDQETEPATFLANLSYSESTKLCVSSRPYPIFQNVFNDSPQFPVELLTLKDITLFVAKNSARVQSSMRCASSVQNHAPTRSSKSLTKHKESFCGCSSWSDRSLKDWLKATHWRPCFAACVEIPPDLDEFFHRTIASIPRRECLYATMYFNIVLAIDWPQILLCFYFVEEADSNLSIPRPCRRSMPKLSRRSKRV